MDENRKRGKIAALAKLDGETGGALEYECMAILRERLPAAVFRYGWSGIALLADHASEGSAIYRAMYPEISRFASDMTRADILAGIFDIFAKVHAKDPLNPTTYPRPYKTGDGKKYGAGAIPAQDFNEWYYGEEVQ